MILIHRNATEEVILGRVRDWVERIACGEMEEAFRLVNIEGYEVQWRPRHLLAILRDFCSDLYPEETDFRVTSWRTAEASARKPLHEVVWYEPNPSFLAVVNYDLPLNGRWSDLQAVFILRESDDPDQLLLQLEDFDQDGRNTQTDHPA